MLYIERREIILQMLKRDGNVKVNELVEMFNVDATTIRRDLKELSKSENINVVYGGAYYVKEETEGIIEITPSEKRLVNLERKKIIAQKAAALIEDGDTVVLDNGITCELILDYLDDLNSINLITQSLAIGAKATQKPFINLYIPGGKYRPLSGMFYGDLAAETIKKLSANKIFFGILCVSITHGITHPFIEEISTLRSLIDISQQKYLIADSTKFRKVSMGKVIELDAFDAFIVDDDLPTIYREYAENHGIEII